MQSDRLAETNAIHFEFAVSNQSQSVMYL